MNTGLMIFLLIFGIPSLVVAGIAFWAWRVNQDYRKQKSMPSRYWFPGGRYVRRL